MTKERFYCAGFWVLLLAVIGGGIFGWVKLRRKAAVPLVGQYHFEIEHDDSGWAIFRMNTSNGAVDVLAMSSGRGTIAAGTTSKRVFGPIQEPAENP